MTFVQDGEQDVERITYTMVREDGSWNWCGIGVSGTLEPPDAVGG